MRLEVLRSERLKTGFGIAVSHESFLSRLAGRREGLCFAVLVQDRLSNDGADWVASRNRIVEAFENDGGHTLPASIAVGTFIEGEAFTIRREEA